MSRRGGRSGDLPDRLRKGRPARGKRKPAGLAYQHLKIRNSQHSQESDKAQEPFISRSDHDGNIAGISERDVNWEMYCTSVLGEEDFELLKRIAIENRTMLEASSELGISVETCKKRIQRAKKKLKDSITKNFL